MKRLTCKTAGDALRSHHYIHGPGVKKDDLLQRLGKLEDAIEQIERIVRVERFPMDMVRKINGVIDGLEGKK